MEIEEAVGRAVRVALDAALTCPVYDHPPDNQVMPFVTFDRHMVEPYDDIDQPMSRHRLTLAVYSDKRGAKQVRDILGRIRRALHRADLELANGESVLCVVERVDATREPDGRTYMGTAQIEIITDNIEA